MSAVRSIIARAFALATHAETVACGPFSIRLGLNDRVREQGVRLSFADGSLPDDHPADFTAAIVGGVPLPEEFAPIDPAQMMIMETGEFYILWTPAPEGVLYIYDFVNRTSVMWCAQAALPVWLLTRPILPLIHAHSSGTEWVPIHSAAVGRNGHFLLLAGPGKAGKSTASLACATAGWDYAGDDFVLVNPTRRLVAPLYTTGRMRTSQPTNLTASLLDYVYNETNDDNDPRLELHLNRGPRKTAIRGGRIHSILIPRRRNGPAFHPVRARVTEAFAAIISSTRLSLLGFGGSLTGKVMTAAGSVPAFFVDTGNDPMAIPAGLQRVLETEI